MTQRPSPDQRAAWLRAVRAVLRMSQRELAERLGVTELTVLRLERGHSPVRDLVLLAVERVLLEEAASRPSMSVACAPRLCRDMEAASRLRLWEAAPVSPPQDPSAPEGPYLYDIRSDP